MSDFLHGWRRKAGLVILVMACGLMAAWIRSSKTTNHIGFFTGAHSLCQVISRQQTVAIRIVQSELPVQEVSVDRVLLMGFQPPQGNSTGHLAVNIDPTTRAAEGSPYRWILNWRGFEIGRCSDGQFPLQVFVVCVPYWLIIMPMTLLSGYLLVRKPKHSIQK